MIENMHLSEEEIAICADAINEGQYENLSLAIRNHLASCDECASEVLMVTDIAFDFKSVEQKVKVINFKTWIIAVASIAAVGLIGFVAIYSFYPKQQVLEAGAKVKIEKNDSFGKMAGVTQIPADTENVITSGKSNAEKNKNSDKKLIALYAPNESLEKLSNNFANAYRGESITVYSKPTTHIPGTDSLKWSNPDQEQLTIEIFNNKGIKILTLARNSTGISIQKLSKGLYYWKLINADFDLLFVGKIVVD